MKKKPLKLWTEWYHDSVSRLTPCEFPFLILLPFHVTTAASSCCWLSLCFSYLLLAVLFACVVSLPCRASTHSSSLMNLLTWGSNYINNSDEATLFITLGFGFTLARKSVNKHTTNHQQVNTLFKAGWGDGGIGAHLPTTLWGRTSEASWVYPLYHFFVCMGGLSRTKTKRINMDDNRQQQQQLAAVLFLVHGASWKHIMINK